MYSPQEMLDALERATPESKSKAIYALQSALATQRDLIEVCQRLIVADEPDLRDLRKVMKRYNSK